MPITTLNPTVPTTPDQGGTFAVSGINNNGHSSTLTSASALDTESQPPEDNSESKSAKWSSFQAAPPNLVSLKLKLSWTVNGSVSVQRQTSGTGLAGISFDIEYSINGGASWISTLSRSKLVGVNSSDSINESGSIAIDLNVNQNVALVQVRDRMNASASANAPDIFFAEVLSNASIETAISNIRLEAEEMTVPSPSGSAKYCAVMM